MTFRPIEEIVELKEGSLFLLRKLSKNRDEKRFYLDIPVFYGGQSLSNETKEPHILQGYVTHPKIDGFKIYNSVNNEGNPIIYKNERRFFGDNHTGLINLKSEKLFYLINNIEEILNQDFKDINNIKDISTGDLILVRSIEDGITLNHPYFFGSLNHKNGYIDEYLNYNSDKVVLNLFNYRRDVKEKGVLPFSIFPSNNLSLTVK